MQLMLVENSIDQIDVVLQANPVVLDVLKNDFLGDRLVLAQQVEQSRSGGYRLHAQVEQLSNEPVVILLQCALVGGIEVGVQVLVALLGRVVLVKMVQKRGDVFKRAFQPEDCVSSDSFICVWWVKITKKNFVWFESFAMITKRLKSD